MNQDKIIDIEDLTPDAHNFNQGTDEGRQLMQRSLTELGAGRSILVDRNGNVIAGNKTQEAAIKAGIRRVRVIETDGTELVAVKRTDIDIDSAKGRELALVDNLATQVNLAWDEAELEAMDVEGFDPASWGLELDIKDPTADVEVKEDDFDPDAQPVPTICKTGDLWQLGNHRLICGDSTDVNVIDKLMDGKKADISFTSPPYNVGNSAVLNGNTHMTECKYQSGNDDLSDYDELLIGTTDNMLMFSKWSFINLQMLANNKRVICEWLNNYKDSLCDIAIWYKNATAPAMAEKVMNSQFEFVFIFSNENNSRAIGTKDFRGTVSNVYMGSAQRKNDYASIHSATFPVEFANHFVENFTNEGDSVLDVFGGTGTTMIVCEQIDRKCYMCELDESYCDVIIDRWEKFTGQKAVLIKE